MSLKSFVLVPVLAGHARHHLLREDIEWFLRDFEVVEFSVPNGTQQCDGLDQFVPA